MPTNYDKIREENILEYGQGIRHLSFLGRLYTDRTHFIFELLQNAEDAGATQIMFRLFNDRLEVAHDGRLFDELDVKGLCGVGEGTKAEDLTQIGKFGIGFKSVYAYSSTPEIYSGNEAFKIDNYVRPYSIPTRQPGNLCTTLFVLPFDKEGIDPDIACRQIGARLQKLSARTLLFLRKISRIEYELPNSTGGIYLREEVACEPARKVNVIWQNNGIEDEESWLIFERPVPGKTENVHVEISFRLETEEKDGKKEERIKKVKDSPLIVYFPTEKETRLGFLIQGPYRTTPSRDTIPKDDDWNSSLIGETANLITEILPQVKQLGLLSVSFLEALPIRMDDFPADNMFYPIVVAVQQTLKVKDLLPTDKGSFVSATNAKLGRSADLRKLLNEEQLRKLYQSTGTIKWLTGEITENRTPDLHTYLMKELNVEEVTPEVFSRKITESFLLEQTDEWMVLMYRYVYALKKLWNKSGWDGNEYSYVPGPLRSKPIIRLSDGKQVIPFLDDGSPKAYLTSVTNSYTSLPTVKTEISRDIEACKFLSELGIPELDIVVEVMEEILPKYTNDSSAISLDENRHDIVLIEKAYATDSQEKKTQLRDKLLKTPFIRAMSQFDGVVTYMCPEKLYFGIDDLLPLYFSGNKDVGFVVYSEYSESARILFKHLGIGNSVKVKRKDKNWQGFIPICDYHSNHTRGLNGFDPDIQVDGLKIALSLPTLKKSQFIWNNIVVPNSDCIRGIVEFCPRRNFDHNTASDRISNLGKLLMESPWLPDLNGEFRKPCDLLLDELPGSFNSDEKVANKLGMKLDVLARLAKEAGISTEDIDLIRSNAEEFKQWKTNFLARKEELSFPSNPLVDQERRTEKMGEKISEAPQKEYKPIELSVRTSKLSNEEIKIWLKNKYSYESGLMYCQICKQKMPFKKRDGDYYFVAVEVLSRIHLPKELEAQYLALCPVCAAMYIEFIKKVPDAMTDLKNHLLSTDDCVIPLKLGDLKIVGLEPTIRFDKAHFQYLRMIIDEAERNK